MAKTNKRLLARRRRKMHIRKVVRGTAARPRLCVFRSARHIYVQLVDDTTGVTLASASTMSPELKGLEGGTGNRSGAKAVGELVARKSIEAGIDSVTFDRNGFLYHGRVKALADAARKAGLKF